MIISPKYDDFLKKMFHNEIVLTYFISDMLGIPREDIRTVRLKNTFLWRRYQKQKLGIVDVLAELNDDTKINIELQIKVLHNWDKRQLFYLCRMYGEELGRGEDYQRLKKCVAISILDFNLSNRKKYHTVYRLRDEDGSVFSDMLELHVLELNKELTGQGKVEDWIRFFNAKTEEDLRMIGTKNPGIAEAIRELKEMSMSRPLRQLYDAHMKRVRDERARDQYVRMEGEAKGIAKGEEQMSKLITLLLSEGRKEDALLAAKDTDVRNRLYKEYGIKKELGQDPAVYKE